MFIEFQASRLPLLVFCRPLSYNHTVAKKKKMQQVTIDQASLPILMELAEEIHRTYRKALAKPNKTFPVSAKKKKGTESSTPQAKPKVQPSTNQAQQRRRRRIKDSDTTTKMDINQEEEEEEESELTKNDTVVEDEEDMVDLSLKPSYKKYGHASLIDSEEEEEEEEPAHKTMYVPVPQDTSKKQQKQHPDAFTSEHPLSEEQIKEALKMEPQPSLPITLFIDQGQVLNLAQNPTDTSKNPMTQATSEYRAEQEKDEYGNVEMADAVSVPVSAAYNTLKNVVVSILTSITQGDNNTNETILKRADALVVLVNQYTNQGSYKTVENVFAISNDASRSDQDRYRARTEYDKCTRMFYVLVARLLDYSPDIGHALIKKVIDVSYWARKESLSKGRKRGLFYDPVFEEEQKQDQDAWKRKLWFDFMVGMTTIMSWSSNTTTQAVVFGDGNANNYNDNSRIMYNLLSTNAFGEAPSQYIQVNEESPYNMKRVDAWVYPDGCSVLMGDFQLRDLMRKYAENASKKVSEADPEKIEQYLADIKSEKSISGKAIAALRVMSLASKTLTTVSGPLDPHMPVALEPLVYIYGETVGKRVSETFAAFGLSHTRAMLLLDVCGVTRSVYPYTREKIRDQIMTQPQAKAHITKNIERCIRKFLKLDAVIFPNGEENEYTTVCVRCCVVQALLDLFVKAEPDEASLEAMVSTLASHAPLIKAIKSTHTSSLEFANHLHCIRWDNDRRTSERASLYSEHLRYKIIKNAFGIVKLGDFRTVPMVSETNVTWPLGAFNAQTFMTRTYKGALSPFMIEGTMRECAQEMIFFEYADQHDLLQKIRYFVLQRTGTAPAEFYTLSQQAVDCRMIECLLSSLLRALVSMLRVGGRSFDLSKIPNSLLEFVKIVPSVLPGKDYVKAMFGIPYAKGKLSNMSILEFFYLKYWDINYASFVDLIQKYETMKPPQRPAGTTRTAFGVSTEPYLATQIRNFIKLGPKTLEDEQTTFGLVREKNDQPPNYKYPKETFVSMLTRTLSEASLYKQDMDKAAALARQAATTTGLNKTTTTTTTKQ